MERGQASLEYVAVVLVLGVVLAAGIALAPGAAAAIPRAVVGGIQRGLCLVAGGDCLSGEPRPCVTSSSTRASTREASFAIARLKDSRVLAREELSDGRVALTELDSSGAGAGLALGAQLRLGRVGARAAADLELGVTAGAGRRWVLPGVTAADRLAERLARDGPKLAGGARAVADYLRDGDADGADQRLFEVELGGEATAALRALGAGPRAEALGELTSGLRVDRRSGERTLLLRVDGSVTGELTAPLDIAGASGAADSGQAAELTLSRDGSPVALTVRKTAAIRGGVKAGPLGGAGGDSLEAEARLDLADPSTRALVDALISHPSPSSARALAARIADRARIDLRVYETTRDEKSRGAGLGLLARFGVEQVDTTDTARLVAAAGREPGQGWARRLDCVFAAAA